MAKKTLQQVLTQIEALQKEAAALRAVEVKDVITRIQEAIGHYGLTPKDLFPETKRSKEATPRVAAAKISRRKSAGQKTPGVPKYADPAGSGRTWTGQGKRPAWFVAAVTDGKQPEDLLIR